MPAPVRHVMFSPSAAGSLRSILSKEQRADEVLCPLDDFSFGPIDSDDDARVDWVEQVLGYTGWEEVTDTTAAFFDALQLPGRIHDCVVILQQRKKLRRVSVVAIAYG